MSSDRPASAPSVGRTALDDVDRAILDVLAKDGRISVRALAERVHISRANAYARLHRLVADDVVTGFTIRVNAARAGFPTSAYVAVSIEQNSWRAVSRHLRDVPYVEHLTLVGGDFDVLVLVRTPDNAALREVVLERIHEIPGVRSTRTWLVFDEAPGHHATGR